MSSFAERQVLFSELAGLREHDVMALITSTKKPEPLFAAQLAQDVLPIVYELLKGKSGKGNVDLFIYSSGGQIDLPWPLINLIKEYYDEVHAIVPWRAHSAATLVTLGANSIVMGPLASLSPIDPQLQLKLTEKKEVVQASVEDVYGYYDLVNDILKLDAPGKAEALKILATRIYPELLGKVSRTRREIRVIATNLLRLHLTDEDRIERIVKELVETLPSHQYMINRNEATKIGLPVKYLDGRAEEISSKLLNSYINEAKMDEPGMSIHFAAGKTTEVMEMSRAFVETKDRSFAFRTKYTFHQDGKVEQAINQWMEVTPQ